jgi:integrating conjugative element protein (TIGR03759 family)
MTRTSRINRSTVSYVHAWVVAGLLLCSGAAQAGASDAVSKASRTPVETSRLTASERAQSEQWDLTETEWSRYKTLMQGIRGKLSPNISPIEGLGIHARTEAERRYYAERWARSLHDDTERVLAFQRAYDAAWKERYGNEPLIDVSRLRQAQSAALLQPGDRVLFFTASSCPACGPVLETLLAKLERTPNLGLDVYLVDSANDDAKVRTWAKDYRVPPQLVRSRTVTLNHENGALARLSGFTGAVPYVVRRRAGTLTPIASHRLGAR